MSGLSPHATEFSPGQAHDDYDDDFDDDSFEDDAPQQLSPISEAVPPTTPMSPRDEASLDAREEFIRRWRAKEAEADTAMRVVDQSRKPIDRTILPPAPVPEPMQIEGGDAAAAREEARQLRDQLSLIRKEQVVHPSQQDESPRVAQLLREKETLLEEVAARDRTVATLENQLGDARRLVLLTGMDDLLLSDERQLVPQLSSFLARGGGVAALYLHRFWNRCRQQYRTIDRFPRLIDDAHTRVGLGLLRAPSSDKLLPRVQGRLVARAHRCRGRHGFADRTQLLWGVIFEAIIVEVVVVVVVRLPGAELRRVGAEAAHASQLVPVGSLLGAAQPCEFGVAIGGSHPRWSARRPRTAGPVPQPPHGSSRAVAPAAAPCHSLAWAQNLGARLPGPDDPVVRRRALASAQASRPASPSVSIA